MKSKIKLVNETKFGTKEFKKELAVAQKAREIVEAWNVGVIPSHFDSLKESMLDSIAVSWGYELKKIEVNQ